MPQEYVLHIIHRMRGHIDKPGIRTELRQPLCEIDARLFLVPVNIHKHHIIILPGLQRSPEGAYVRIGVYLLNRRDLQKQFFQFFQRLRLVVADCCSHIYVLSSLACTFRLHLHPLLHAAEILLFHQINSFDFYKRNVSQSSFFLAVLISRSQSAAPFMPLAISAAWAAILEAIIPSLTSSTSGRRRCSAGVT